MNPRHMRPMCPYCGSIAPHGDSRLVWIGAHLDSRLHRCWWFVRRRFKRRKR